MSMRIIPVANTELTIDHLMDDVAIERSGYQVHRIPLEERENWIRHMDELSEAAGRVCYQSFGRPNPKTSSNKNYLSNIIDQKHFSVIEHASVTFYVDGVSRSLLTELERHRHLSFSVQSQRYVDEGDSQFVMPPAFSYLEKESIEQVAKLHEEMRDLYQKIYMELKLNHLGNKEAREAARSVLPNGTETKFFVTGNLRTWREIIQKRMAPGADAEICQFASKVHAELLQIAPNAMQRTVLEDD